MPFEAIPRPEHDLVITAPYGRVTNAGLSEYYTERLANETLRPELKELVDGRWIQQFDVDAAGQEALVDLLDEHQGRLEGVRWGFIADSMVSFGMFRMFEAQKAELPFETSVFRTPGAAAEWLKVPVSELIIDPPAAL